MSGVAHTFPFRMRPGLGRVGEAWYGKAVTLWFELLQAGRWDLSSQTPAVSRAVRRSPGPGIGPLKPWEEGLPQDPPLVMTVNPRVDQRGRPDSQGKWGPSLPTTRWISGKLQGLTRTLPQPSPAVKLVPWGTAPTCARPHLPREDSFQGEMGSTGWLWDRASRHVLWKEAPHVWRVGEDPPEPLGGPPEHPRPQDTLHLQRVRESLRSEHAPGPAPGGAHGGEAPRVHGVRQGLRPAHPPEPARRVRTGEKP